MEGEGKNMTILGLLLIVAGVVLALVLFLFLVGQRGSEAGDSGQGAQGGVD
ncbi:MAG TPA: hypothetical protein VNE63_04900 [Candidatus Acidoferrales bacterium]|nr:hypothetical protein [Candidatus Acidoferrales bacterium]